MKYALENIRVVELGGYIVGSFCATLLADMGADAIKIEPLTGDGLRGQLGSFQGYNRGKRGMAVDLHTEEGKAILYRLVKRADVLVQNLRQGVAEGWGVDYKTVSSFNPRLVYLAMPGFGQSGPYIQKPAFDPLLQAMSGAMAAQGGEGNPPVYLRAAISDFAGAMLGAYGVAMALYTRAKTGQGQYLHSSLLNAAIAIQAGEFIDYPGKREEPRIGTLGKAATYRLYQTKKGWFFLGCETEEQWQALCQAIERQDLISDSRFASPKKRLKNDTRLSAVLESVFQKAATGQWVKKLEKAGVPCSRIYYYRHLFKHKQLHANGLIAEHESADLGMVRQRGMVVNLSATPGRLQRAAPALGQHDEEVLTELGYSAEEIQNLRAKGVIK